MAQQSANPTQIQFNGSGQPTSFDLDTDKYIWIPSRKFAEGLYYQLNFRHSEMLNETTDGYEYVSPAELSDTIDQMQGTSFWGTLSNWLQSQIETLYTETLEFHKKMYDFAIQTLTNTIPRGVGFYFDASLGVTWGYPIATDIATSKSFWRKMTPINELTFVLREESEVYLGIDVVVGYSAGFKIGSGKKKGKTGVNVGAGFEAGLGPRVTMEYEFPIRPEETGLISFLLTFTTAGRAMSDIMGALNVINVSPRNYLTWMQLAMPISGRVWVAGQVGIDENGEPVEGKNIKAPQTNNPAEEAKDNSFLSIDNFLNKVSSIGAQGQGELTLGIEMNYFAKYDDKPLVPEKSGRVPSEVEVEMLYCIQSKLDIGGIGSLLGTIFANVAISGLFGSIEFDKGFGIGIGYIYKRTLSARNLTYNDAKLDFNSINTIQDDPNLKYNGGNWEVTINFQSFTGEPDRLCKPGTEATIKLNAKKIYEILQGSGNYSFSDVDDIINIFYSYGYRYKMGFGFNSHQRKTLDGEIFGSLTNGQMVTGVTKDFLVKAKENTWGLDLYAGINVGVELLIEDIAEVLKYYMSKAYISIRIILTQSVPEMLEFELEMRNEKGKKINELNPGGDSISDIDYYPELFAELNQYLFDNYGSYLQAPNFKDVFKIYSQLYKVFNTYLFNTKSPDLDENGCPLTIDVSSVTGTISEFKDMDLGVIDIINALALTARMLNASAALEAKVGLSFAGNIKAGFKATVRLSASAAGGFIGQMKFMENGEFIEILPGDPYRIPLETIKKLLDTSMANGSKREEGLRRSLIQLPQ